MINRHYFMSCIKYHNDGNGSHSEFWEKRTRKSFLPQVDDVYYFMLNEAKKALRDAPGDKVVVRAFSRV